VEDSNTVPAVATASLNMFSPLSDAVGAAHCQEGTNEYIYVLEDISSGTQSNFSRNENLAGRNTRRRKRNYTKKSNKKLKTKRRHSMKKKRPF
jgi:hypothetical protein